MSLSPVIGVLTVTLHLPASGSLKAKRQVVAGLLRRIRARYGVAAAEVGERNLWQIAHLAVTCVSQDASHCDEIMANVLTYIEKEAREARITDVRTELLRV
jgi:uncharacterized protein YlxP (DUF503 family)